MLAAMLCSTTMAAADEIPSLMPLFEEPEATAVESAAVPARSASLSRPVQDKTDSSVIQTVSSAQDDAAAAPRSITEISPSLDYAWGDVDKSTLPENFSDNPDNSEIVRVIHKPLLLQWQASNMWYHPVYFEDPTLERYGHTYDPLVQSLVSPARFVGQAVTLPYHATLRPPNSREYPLGWYRPGEAAPYLKYKPAWNNEAAINQALSVVGLVFFIP